MTYSVFKPRPAISQARLILINVATNLGIRKEEKFHEFFFVG